MNFFFAPNLVTQSVVPGLPWEFQVTEQITEQIRKDKHERQNFYQNPATRHCFYSGLEGVNAGVRCGKDNPVRAVHAIVADYDIPIPDARIDEALESMPVKASWVETSLGGNRRLIWILERPLLVDGNDFGVYFLQSCEKFLNLNLLPALDLPALTTTSRLFCRGDIWKATGHGPVPFSKLQAHFVKIAQAFRFKEMAQVNVGLDVVEKAIKEKFPNFNWPGEFAEGSQGPSFFIPESVSPLSAIVKAEGMLTFSAHATKMFYDWASILGKEFITEFAEKSVAAGTSDIYFDGHRYHRKIGESWASSERGEFTNYLKVSCRMSAKPDGQGHSAVDRALDHIHCQQRVVGAAPFVFMRPGLIEYQGKRTLNIYDSKPLEPAIGAQIFGSVGNFPFISTFFLTLFDPPEQLIRFNAWLKYYYESAYLWMPRPGQNLVLQGGVGIGKTFVNRQIIGTLVGGFADASGFLVDGGTFNSQLLAVPHMVLDDDTPTSSYATANRTHMLFKKIAANSEWEFHKKFEVPCMVQWVGRLGITANLDFQSSRIIGPLDNSSLDKLNLFRCIADNEGRAFKFPNREDTIRFIRAELPYYARWLLDWKVSDEIERDPRYGFVSFQEPSLLEQCNQTNPSAPFKEILLDSLAQWFRENPSESVWSGTVSAINRLLMSNPLNESILRSLRLEQSNRYLEQLQKENSVKAEVSTDANSKTRVWTFSKPPQP